MNTRRCVKLNKLRDAGHKAALDGMPCNAPTSKEIERAAWEIGYRQGKREKRDKNIKG